MLIKASSHQPLQITARAGEGTAVTFATSKDSALRKFYSTYWPIHSDKRCLILLVQDKKRIQLKQIFDDVPSSTGGGEGR